MEQIKHETYESLKRNERKTAVVLCGAPGAGKSTCIPTVLHLKNITSYIILDPDLVRRSLLDRGMEERRALALQTDFNMEFVDFAILEKQNIIYNTVCRSTRKADQVIMKLHEAGYYIVFVMVYSSRARSLARIKHRNTRLPPNDKLPEKVAFAAYNQLHSLANHYIDEDGINQVFNEVLLYVNEIDDAEPKLIYHRIDDAVRVCEAFEQYYNASITC
jgi:predicted kinase